MASVDAQGNYYLNQNTDPDQPISAQEVATLVAAQLQLEPETPVMVNGDGAVSYNQVVQLMVLLVMVCF